MIVYCEPRTMYSCCSHNLRFRIIFFLSVALTSGAMLLERNEGLLERSLVSGITGTEILFGQVVTQFTVMIGQTVMMLIFVFAIFKVTLQGDIGLVIALTILAGMCGMCFGKCRMTRASII